MSRYKREIDTQCCNAWMHGIRTINGQYPDDNRDFDINAGNGIRIEPATGGITIINDSAASSFVAGDNIEITPSGDDLVIGLVSDPHISGNIEVDGTTTLNDTLQVNGDIIQNGAAYETHAEKIYTTNDYIVTRDGAISALSPGDYSGFQVKKYDGTNDGRLVIDNAGVARVGDVGDEQPLLTRDESADLTNGECLVWDSANQKAKTEAIPSDIATALNSKINTLYRNSASSSVSSGLSVDISPITIDEDGSYLVIARGTWTDNNNGRRFLGIYFNGQQKWFVNQAAQNETYQSGSAIYDFSAGTTIYTRGYQDSGTTLTLAGQLYIIKLI